MVWPKQVKVEKVKTVGELVHSGYAVEYSPDVEIMTRVKVLVDI
jgi:hypothetical protein